MSSELERQKRVIASLKKAVVELSNKSNKKEKESRREIISGIMDTVKYKSQEQRQNVLDALTDSELPVEGIREMYQETQRSAPIYNCYL